MVIFRSQQTKIRLTTMVRRSEDGMYEGEIRNLDEAFPIWTRGKICPSGLECLDSTVPDEHSCHIAGSKHSKTRTTWGDGGTLTTQDKYSFFSFLYKKIYISFNVLLRPFGKEIPLRLENILVKYTKNCVLVTTRDRHNFKRIIRELLKSS